jgi:hypothetical protein
VTVGLMQGIGDMMGGSGLPGAAPSPGMQMGASTANAEFPDMTVSDAGGGMGSTMPSPANEAQVAPYRYETVIVNGVRERAPIALCGSTCGLSPGQRFASFALDASNFVFPGAGALVATLGKAAIKPAATAGTQTFYRTMSQSNYQQLVSTGKVPATYETFMSPSLKYAQRFDGVTVELTTTDRTLGALMEIGVKHNSVPAGLLDTMPALRTGADWVMTDALFKFERGVLNIGLGRGTALDLLNNNLLRYRVVP